MMYFAPCCISDSAAVDELEKAQATIKQLCQEIHALRNKLQDIQNASDLKNRFPGAAGTYGNDRRPDDSGTDRPEVGR